MRISKISVAILYRCQMHPEFTKLFGVRTDDLVHLHTFRVAIIILMGLQMHNLGSEVAVEEDDLNVCLSALQAIARVHVTGQKCVHLDRARSYKCSNQPLIGS
jgi:hypothetical protein